MLHLVPGVHYQEIKVLAVDDVGGALEHPVDGCGWGFPAAARGLQDKEMLCDLGKILFCPAGDRGERAGEIAFVFWHEQERARTMKTGGVDHEIENKG